MKKSEKEALAVAKKAAAEKARTPKKYRQTTNPLIGKQVKVTKTLQSDRELIGLYGIIRKIENSETDFELIHVKVEGYRLLFKFHADEIEIIENEQKPKQGKNK